MVSLILTGCSKEKANINVEQEIEEQVEIVEEVEVEEQVEIVEVSSDADELSEENFIKIVKKNLNVPDKEGITYSMGEIVYWDAGQCYYRDVEFYEEGENVAGAFVDPQTGELVRSIHTYE